ncbi:hypothetical protein BGW80DRAFT_1458507 [Lactifluus volemus]|nr:hypothetical protein BGW80DRAFT_1458507 [Lactifluus volemus]
MVGPAHAASYCVFPANQVVIVNNTKVFSSIGAGTRRSYKLPPTYPRPITIHSHAPCVNVSAPSSDPSSADDDPSSAPSPASSARDYSIPAVYSSEVPRDDVTLAACQL